jgi:Fe-S oxidoreductase
MNFKPFETPTHHCVYCPRLCRAACPVETASARESLTPKMKMQVFREMATGAIAPSADAAEVLWGCSDCGACEDACLHGNPVGAALYAGRALAVSRGAQPAAMQGVAERFAKQLNPSGESLLAVQDLVAGSVVRDADVSTLAAVTTQVVLGCDALTHAPETARRAMVVARRIDAEAEAAVLHGLGAPLPVCCGRVLREAGETAAYDEQLARMREAFGSREVWVLEPACLEDVQRAAPQARLLSEAMQKLEPRKRVPQLVLQSSCGVKRHARAQESLLALAQKVSDDVRVPAADLPFAGCCGGRGGLREVMPQVAAEMGRSRQAELAALNAPVAHFSTCCQRQLGVEATHLLELYE